MRRNVALSGVLGGLAGLALALMTLYGPLAGLDPGMRGLAGLVAGFLVYASWYAASVITGGRARTMRLVEVIESLIAFYLVLLPMWVGFYNALLGW